jgi:glutamate--cysteine ligase
VDVIVAVGREMGLSFLGLGISPKTPLKQMPWMPKERYRIMRRIMAETGKLGHRMMQQTATVQGNFDYASETDARKKLRLAMAMAPVLVAVSANSAIVDGRPSGYKSYRAHIWTQTDPARCGLLPFVFDTESIFSAYAQYALDVPMYFVYRDGKYLPSLGRTFREFLAGRVPGLAPRISDWATHLTTLFPEARLKTYIEVRAADSQMPHLMLGTPALMKGLLYDTDCLDAAWDVVARWSFSQRLELGTAAAREGMAAAVGRHSLRDYANDLVSIALEGLHRQRCLNNAGSDETIYLAPLADDVANGICPSDRTLRDWSGVWGGDIKKLVAATAYTPEMVVSQA